MIKYKVCKKIATKKLEYKGMSGAVCIQNLQTVSDDSII